MEVTTKPSQCVCIVVYQHYFHWAKLDQLSLGVVGPVQRQSNGGIAVYISFEGVQEA